MALPGARGGYGRMWHYEVVRLALVISSPPEELSHVIDSSLYGAPGDSAITDHGPSTSTTNAAPY
ncbi:predicted protein [Histoplasma capsulatum var. duboisii H88]|uniref:Predicted protein n=1 Tax=Ajellomyces capsulatus (strain H88) TaxID=544711 RepID=F0UJC9_AJEC8|nr:predicted protein [Histoplasma capsulatum var. duboisii H88]